MTNNRKMRLTTIERYNALMVDYLAGHTAAEVAKMHNVSMGMVQAAIDYTGARGKHKRGKRGILPPERKCKKCLQVKSIENFALWYSNKGSGRRTICCTNLDSFNLTWEEYEIMLANQGGVCAICKLPPVNKRLAVDHNHITGKIRGLLCASCNIGLGHFKDNLVLLEQAKAYLQLNMV